GWAVSLHAKPALFRERVHGGGHRGSRLPLRVLFSGARQLDFCLPPNLSGRRRVAANSGRVVSRLLSISAAILAIATAARRAWKSTPALGASIRRRNFRLVVRIGRASDRTNVGCADRLRAFWTGICRLLH